MSPSRRHDDRLVDALVPVPLPVAAPEPAPCRPAARHLCGIHPGVSVLPSAFPGRNVVLAHPSYTIATLAATATTSSIEDL
ncbi:hypothetical protein [Micromonospora sp. NPDC004704]